MYYITINVQYVRYSTGRKIKYFIVYVVLVYSAALNIRFTSKIHADRICSAGISHLFQTMVDACCCFTSLIHKLWWESLKILPETHNVLRNSRRGTTGRLGHMIWNSVLWGKKYFYWADQSSQGRIKPSCTGMTSPMSQPSKDPAQLSMKFSL